MLDQFSGSEELNVYKRPLCRLVQLGKGIAKGRDKAVVGLRRLRWDKVRAVSALYKAFIRQVRFSAENSNAIPAPEELYCE